MAMTLGVMCSMEVPYNSHAAFCLLSGRRRRQAREWYRCGPNV